MTSSRASISRGWLVRVPPTFGYPSAGCFSETKVVATFLHSCSVRLLLCQALPQYVWEAFLSRLWKAVLKSVAAWAGGEVGQKRPRA